MTEETMTLPPTHEGRYIQKVANDGKTDEIAPVGVVMKYSAPDPPDGWQWFDAGPGAIDAPPRRQWLTEEQLRMKRDEETTRLERLVAEAVRDAIIACAPNSPGHFGVNGLELYESDGNLTIDCLEIARAAMRVHLDNMTLWTGGSKFEERG
jgi:hypothetical protein